MMMSQILLAKLPENFPPLRSHQLEALHQMVFHELAWVGNFRNNLGCIANHAGSGKTRIALALALVTKANKMSFGQNTVVLLPPAHIASWRRDMAVCHITDYCELTSVEDFAYLNQPCSYLPHIVQRIRYYIEAANTGGAGLCVDNCRFDHRREQEILTSSVILLTTPVLRTFIALKQAYQILPHRIICDEIPQKEMYQSLQYEGHSILWVLTSCDPIALGPIGDSPVIRTSDERHQRRAASYVFTRKQVLRLFPATVKEGPTALLMKSTEVTKARIHDLVMNWTTSACLICQEAISDNYTYICAQCQAPTCAVCIHQMVTRQITTCCQCRNDMVQASVIAPSNPLACEYQLNCEGLVVPGEGWNTPYELLFITSDSLIEFPFISFARISMREVPGMDLSMYRMIVIIGDTLEARELQGILRQVYRPNRKAVTILHLSSRNIN